MISSIVSLVANFIIQIISTLGYAGVGFLAGAHWLPNGDLDWDAAVSVVDKVKENVVWLTHDDIHKMHRTPIGGFGLGKKAGIAWGRLTKQNGEGGEGS